MFVTDMAGRAEVLAAHTARLPRRPPGGDDRRASTALLDPTLLVEIEVDARRPG